MAEFASKGVAGTALGLGIAGTYGLLNQMGCLFNFGNRNTGCAEEILVNRYELGKEGEITQLKMEKAHLESTIYTDKKIADVYERLNDKIEGVNAALSQQAVYNATNTATLSCLKGQVDQLTALTEVIVPASHICPPPMPLYNCWKEPVCKGTPAK